MVQCLVEGEDARLGADPLNGHKACPVLARPPGGRNSERAAPSRSPSSRSCCPLEFLAVSRRPPAFGYFRRLATGRSLLSASLPDVIDRAGFARSTIGQTRAPRL